MCRLPQAGRRAQGKGRLDDGHWMKIIAILCCFAFLHLRVWYSGTPLDASLRWPRRACGALGVVSGATSAAQTEWVRHDAL